jgi:pseudaminic acid synthase
VGDDQITLLKFTTIYQAIIEEANLCTIQNIAEKFNLIRGLSKNNLGYIIPITATILGKKSKNSMKRDTD